eukprot:TRINITY_DN48583_c0_g1_i1.p1 TRINITY_DN48583_c0_g1~~TRINITY_DN48583_c0_g1_i1.p1  ORF type:complete len:482 (+),score=88.84 TRINITY_DN48583_c0_g1_i1:79-1446(+)
MTMLSEGLPDAESIIYVNAGTGWGFIPEAQGSHASASSPAPRIVVGSAESFEETEAQKHSRWSFGNWSCFSRAAEPTWVRLELFKELHHGDALGIGEFEQCWGGLIRLAERPPPRAQRFGSPWPAEEDVSPRQWLERAGFAVFLRAVGAVEGGEAVPGTPEELRRRCGVVAVEDDGFCGFWCLAYLLRVSLAEALQRVVQLLSPLQGDAAKAREEGRTPSLEERVWERLWIIADAKLQCLRLDLFDSHTVVSSALSNRGLDTDPWLTTAELALLCERFRGWTPIVEVTPDFHHSDDTGDHSMLALAASGTALSPAQTGIDWQNADELREAGRQLYDEGFRLITVEPAAEGRPAEQPRPRLQELKDLRPFVIHLGTHFFVLDTVEELPPGAMHMEGSSAPSSRGSCLRRCLDRCFVGRQAAMPGHGEARAPLRTAGDTRWEGSEAESGSQQQQQLF